MRWKKILCPIDFSANSREAMRVAAELTSEAKIPLVLVYVVQPMPRFEAANVFATSTPEEVAKAEKAIGDWKQAATEYGASNVKALVVEGVPWNRIIEVAKETDSDLIVMGTHSPTGLDRALLGSVAERVVRNADASVLVARKK